MDLLPSATDKGLSFCRAAAELKKPIADVGRFTNAKSEDVCNCSVLLPLSDDQQTINYLVGAFSFCSESHRPTPLGACRFQSLSNHATLAVMNTSSLAALVEFAGRLADTGGEVVRRYFRTPLEVDRKDDETPVTIADREAEAAMRALIEQTYPDHGIVGEEYGHHQADAEQVWVLDPIDGTKAFISGKPMFGTLIAFVEAGRPKLGVIDQPVLGERWLGGAGQGTTFNGRAVTTRSCPEAADALLNATAPDMFRHEDAACFARLSARVHQTMFGGDCYAYGLLASGFIDLVVEAMLQPYDFCALVPVVQGAGGTMTDWRGRELTIKSDGRVVAAGDPTLHLRAVEALAAS